MPLPVEFAESLRAALAERLRGVPRLQYRKSGDAGERWITIGGTASGGKRHAGGTPVKIDGQGKIVAGPKALTGKDLDSFSLKAPKNKEPNPQRGYRQKQLVDTEGPPEPAEPVRTKPAAVLGLDSPTVATMPDGRKVGVTAMTPQELAADPSRFQYKVQGISQEGVTQELKEVRQFRPEFAGQLLVWHDPADGQTYVVNGHHRFELARRTGYDKPLPVYLVDAENEAEARAIGALANIAEGRGTPVDAAKFLRETGRNVQALRDEGVSLKGKVADEASQLARLSDHVFAHVVNDRIPDKWGVTMARHVDDHDVQNQMLGALLKAEERGKNLSDGVVEEMAREFGFAPTKSDTSRSLFGDMEETRSLVVERATVKNAIRRALSSEARAFTEVGRRGREETLAAAGNVLNVEENVRRASEASGALESFDRWAKLKGEVSDAINRFAEELADNPRGEREILRRAERELRPLLSEADRGAMAPAREAFGRYSGPPRGDGAYREGSVRLAGLIHAELVARLRYQRVRRLLFAELDRRLRYAKGQGVRRDSSGRFSSQGMPSFLGEFQTDQSWRDVKPQEKSLPGQKSLFDGVGAKSPKPPEEQKKLFAAGEPIDWAAAFKAELARRAKSHERYAKWSEADAL